MAGTTRKARITGHIGSDVAVTRAEFNKLIDDHDALVAVVNAIILAAATNIGAVAALDDAVVATAGKVGDESGNV